MQQTIFFGFRLWLQMVRRIFWSWGSFAVQFGDDLQSGDHLGACTSGLHRLSRTLGRQNALASSVDWLTGLSTSFMIGQGDVIGFGFTTYNRPFPRSNKQ